MVYCRNDNKTKQKELSGSRALQFVVIDLLATFVLVATVFYGDIILPLETAYNCQSVSYKFAIVPINGEAKSSGKIVNSPVTSL